MTKWTISNGGHNMLYKVYERMTNPKRGRTEVGRIPDGAFNHERVSHNQQPTNGISLLTIYCNTTQWMHIWMNGLSTYNDTKMSNRKPDGHFGGKTLTLLHRLL